MIAWLVYGLVAFSIAAVVVALDAKNGYDSIDDIGGALMIGMFWPVEMFLLVILGIIMVVVSPFMLIARMFSKK